MNKLENKVAVITGARQGMGKAHALALAKEGAKIVVSDISLEECQMVVDEIKNAGGDALAVKCDVSSKAEVEAMFKAAVEKFGRVDILVNNAGIYSPKPFLELTEEDWDRTIDINLKGEFLCAQAAAKEMMKNKWGRIINISSIASGQVGVGIAQSAHYTASKGGVIGMSETLAIELAPYGINVSVVAPGMIDTPMAQVSEMSKEESAFFMNKIPMKRAGKAEEVANMVVFLASEDSSYITGATFYVDGGWLAA
jgi:NAD(P)-dependent dehydrogenase (short-subunit alcohol dehydrogenase family)